jgi:hypothetical protein
MNFRNFDELWNYSEKISSSAKFSNLNELIISSFKEKRYGEMLFYLSSLTKDEDVNIFTSLQDALIEYFDKREED